MQDPASNTVIYQRFSFLCSNNAVFDQQHQTCNDSLNYPCSESYKFLTESNTRLMESVHRTAQSIAQYNLPITPFGISNLMTFDPFSFPSPQAAGQQQTAVRSEQQPEEVQQVRESDQQVKESDQQIRESDLQTREVDQQARKGDQQQQVRDAVTTVPTTTGAFVWPYGTPVWMTRMFG
jgi:hypothetical protein